MFNLHDFVMKTICNMVGNVPDYKVQEYALSWFTRNTLTEEDMVEIDRAVTEQYPTSVPEEIVEPVVDTTEVEGEENGDVTEENTEE